MEMTYAALAKSLGITLKSTSASSSTATTNTSPAPAPPPVSVPIQVPASTSITVEKAEEGEPPTAPELAVLEKREQDREEDREVDDRLVKQDSDATLVPASPVPIVIEKSEEQDKKRLALEARDDSDATDADAEGESDSDIASSRPCSPIVTVSRPSTQDSSQEENSAMETMESQSTEPTSVSQGAINEEDQERDPKEEERSSPETSSSSQPEPLERKIMSDEQLHQAKVLVLDLLGWGVPPEYLLQRGISHALLYTVFTDLRLRLPDNVWEDCVKLVSVQS